MIVLVLSLGYAHRAVAQIQAITGTPKSVSFTSVEAFGVCTPNDLSGMALFRLGTDTNNLCQFATQSVSGTMPTPVTAGFSNLYSNTVYYYQLVVFNGTFTDSAVGNIISFTTLTTAIAENPAVSLKVYPNPVTDILNIDFPSNEEVLCKVFSLTGQKVDEAQFTGKGALNMSTLAPGTYVLEANGTRTKILKR